MRPLLRAVAIEPPPEEQLLAAELASIRLTLQELQARLALIAPRLASVPPQRSPATAGNMLVRLEQERRRRGAFFPAGALDEPAWPILLLLATRELTGLRTTVSAASLVEGSPATTGLRHIILLGRLGLVARERDPADRRRAYLSLTLAGREAMSAYLDAVALGRAATGA